MKQSYVSKYNKENYKQYIFRVRKDDKEIIDKLDSIDNKNRYFYELINNRDETLTLKQIKQRIVPVLNKHNIKEIYLFGSYARGEANKDSDVDIYCEKGDVKTFVDLEQLEDELKEKLERDVDIIFTTSSMDDYFYKCIKEDMIKLC